MTFVEIVDWYDIYTFYDACKEYFKLFDSLDWKTHSHFIESIIWHTWAICIVDIILMQIWDGMTKKTHSTKDLVLIVAREFDFVTTEQKPMLLEWVFAINENKKMKQVYTSYACMYVLHIIVIQFDQISFLLERDRDSEGRGAAQRG